MSKSKTTKKEEAPKKKLSAKKRFYKYVMPVFTVVVGLVSLVIILGLAAKGLAGYLDDLTDTQRITGSIIGVSVLAYSVASLVRLFDK